MKKSTLSQLIGKCQHYVNIISIKQLYLQFVHCEFLFTDQLQQLHP